MYFSKYCLPSKIYVALSLIWSLLAIIGLTLYRDELDWGIGNIVVTILSQLMSIVIISYGIELLCRYLGSPWTWFVVYILPFLITIIFVLLFAIGINFYFGKSHN